ncbi:MAG: hypothetical protein KC431_05625 [Myxococcales bacterium]|nr:hypothetical protein [Myxococcales bacterium]MCA9696983.1 hypothetical protein [Myxococcales bacterium]
MAAALALPLIAASPETLPRRRVPINYNASTVKASISVPELLRESDKQAMKSLDSGWATRLVYDVAVFEKGNARSPLATVQLEVKVQWDPWNRDYMVQTSVGGGKPSLRRFALRADAIKAATVLRVPVARTDAFTRGDDHAYFVTVFAQRNPTQSKSSAAGGSGRGQDRDLEVFSRWVGMFVRSRPKAEQTSEFRSELFYIPED